MKKQAGPQRGQPAGDSVPDPRPAADPGDDGDPAAPREQIPPQLFQGRFGRDHRRPAGYAAGVAGYEITIKAPMSGM